MTKDNDSLGNRIKDYESRPQGERLMPLLPVIARMDGRAFHSFCKGLNRPFDENLSRLMRETTKYLVEETNALIGYTQSDEITLAWFSDDRRTQIFMDARTNKLTSILAAMTTAFFNSRLAAYLPSKAGKLPLFDARVFNVPNLMEAANCFLWRTQDAVRNSISMLGQVHFSHKTLHGLSGSQIQDLLHAEKSLNWNDLPRWAKEGSFLQRKTYNLPFAQLSDEQRAALPAKHRARTDPNLTVNRSDVVEIEMPGPFGKLTNRIQVIFEGATPLLAPSVAENTP